MKCSDNPDELVYLQEPDSHVDISYHSGTQMQRSDNPDELLYLEEPDLRRRQDCFILAISAIPRLAALVRHLTWTFVPGVGGEEDGQLDLAPTWRMFQAFDNLVSLDFVSFDHEPEETVPPPIFLSAVEVRLGGQMSYSMASSILQAIDPASLTSLELNNLQDLGQTSPGRSLCFYTNLTTTPETFGCESVPTLKHPGPMRGHLRSLIGRCTALRRLVLCHVGQDYRPKTSWSVEKDSERYREWADFLQSIRLTLESFEFEQGLQFEDPEEPPPCRNPSWCLGKRPMDERWISSILPVLLCGPWPCLQKLILRGIGGRRLMHCCREPSEPSISLEERQEIELQIKAAIPVHALLILETNALETYYHPVSGPSYRTDGFQFRGNRSGHFVAPDC